LAGARTSGETSGTRRASIGPGGTERYIADPMADHISSGTAYFPAGQITAWGRGIALVAGTHAS